MNTEGEPVARARVVVLGGPGWAVRSSAAGRFEITGLTDGKWAVRAFSDRFSSAPLEVEVGPEGPPAPVTLVLEESRRDRVEVEVSHADGTPLADALVFLQSADHTIRLLSTNRQGRVRFRVGFLFPESVRVAIFSAGAWRFGRWQPVTEGPLYTTWEDQATGSLVLESSEDASIVPEIYSEENWHVTWLLKRVGLPPHATAGSTASVTGLPAGRYRVAWNSRETYVTIESWEETVVDVGGSLGDY